MPAEKSAVAGASGAAGVGLRSMRERVNGFGGELEITSDGRRTLVRALIPFRASASVGDA
jgi:signal transduction histidine kinase